MQYINPFELLKITTTNPSALDGITVNKAKRKLFAEIDLSDTNTITYKGIELTKSDCIRITDDLDKKDISEFHLFILQDKYINEFLCKGSLLFFDNFRFEYIYKQSEFLDFISPYFSEKYDYLLFENYKKKNLKNISSLLLIKPITNEEYHDKCFKSTYALIRRIWNDLEKIYDDIKNNKSLFIEKNFVGLAELIADKVDTTLINLLPSYFQALRNQMAQTIRNISTEINNEYGLYEPAYKIIEISNNVQSDGLVKLSVAKAYNIIKTNNSGVFTAIENDKEEEFTPNQYNADIEIYREEIDNYVDIIRQIDEIILQIDKRESIYITNKFSGLYNWLASKIDVPKLNSQPPIFDDARERIANQLKHLSVTIWKDFKDIEASFSIIQLAGTIEVDAETKKSIQSERNKYGKPVNSAPYLDNIWILGYKLYGSTRYFTILMIPILPLSRYNVKSVNRKDSISKNSRLRFYGELALKPWQKVWKYGFIVGLIALFIIGVANTSPRGYDSSNDTNSNKSVRNVRNFKSSTSKLNTLTLPNPPPPPKLSNNYIPATESIKPVYTYPYMNNGNITGCINIQQVYDQNIDNKLIISCGSNANVAVKLIDYSTDKTIRYVYINRNTTFTLTKIPEGKYYLKIAYGEKWGVVAGEANCKGRFTENSLCKKGTEILDYNITYYQDGSYQVPSFSLSLNVIYVKDNNSNNFDTDKIPEYDFYNE